MATASMETSQSERTVIGLVIAHALLMAAAAAGLPAAAGAQTGQSDAVYVAQLAALNTTVTGLKAAGEATFTIKGDSLTIAVNASGLPKDIEHWQHFHGFTDGRAAACPAHSADANRDGIIDVVETGAAAGTTMVPFSGDPVSMDVPHGTYPKASARGTLHYKETVSLSALQAAFARTFDGRKLDLDRRVIFIHGIPAASKADSPAGHVADRVRQDRPGEVVRFMTTSGMPVGARPAGLRWHHECPVSVPNRLDLTVSVIRRLSMNVVDCSRGVDSTSVRSLGRASQ